MELDILLRDLIKPELNKIYTEPPSSRGGGDMSFFWREHAHHCFFLCRMLGFDAVIRRGDLTISFDDSLVRTSFDSGTDHAWCEVHDIVPVDLSVNFEFYEAKSPNIDLIYGSGQRGVYCISYIADASEYERHVYGSTIVPRIAYLERETVGIPMNDLVDDPHQFLTKPASGGMSALFGPHIFSGINLHLLDLANGKTKRLTTYKDSRSAVRTIASRYPKAINQIRHMASEMLIR
jgi:hypothetical protein